MQRLVSTMLRESFIENAAEPLPVMLWRARPDMSCEYLSRQWLEFTGARAEEALGDGWSRSVHPEDLARWLDTFVRSFDAREAFEIEYRLRRRDGEFRWVLDRGLPRYSADRVFVGFVGACIDIDERKCAEHELARSLERERKLRTATEAASRVKDDFLASVLADLQSPVRAIVTWTAHLRAQVPAASEPARALDAIEHNARAQDRIISSLLALSRAAAGRPARARDAIEHNARAQDRIISSLLELSRVAAGRPARERGGNGAPLLTGVRVLVLGEAPAAGERRGRG